MFTADVLVEGSEFPHLRATTTLISDGSTHVVVDPGGKYDAALLLERLRDRGLRAEDVAFVVNTHMHYDHFENTELFGGARVLIGRREYEEYVECVRSLRGAMEIAPGGPGEPAWRAQVLDAVEETVRARYETINAFYLSRISQGLLRDLAFWTACEGRLEGRLSLVDGEHALAEDVRVIPTPGHTAGHVSVRVGHALEGESVLVAGDAFPTVKWLTGERAAMPLCSDVQEFLQTKERLARASRYIIPGHGRMFRALEPASAGGEEERR